MLIMQGSKRGKSAGKSMRCPRCRSYTTVIDVRKDVGGLRIKRRRECDECGYRFSTAEKIALEKLDKKYVSIYIGIRTCYSKKK